MNPQLIKSKFLAVRYQAGTEHK